MSTPLSRKLGQLTYFNHERGFGFIKPLKGDDIFIHIKATTEPLEVGQWLVFSQQPDTRQPTRVCAVKVCSLVKEAVQWQEGSSTPPAEAVPHLLQFWLKDTIDYFSIYHYQAHIFTLPAADQLLFLRKMCGEIMAGKVKLTLNDLQSIVRYSREESISTGGKLDYTIDLVLNTLSTLADKGEYPKANVLTEELFKYIGENVEELPRLNAELFSKCPGRTVQIKEADPKNDKLFGHVGGTVYPAMHDKSSLLLESGELVPVIDNWVYWKNGKHELIKWENQQSYKYKWNLTVAPRGIRFCEGRLSNKPDYQTKKIFWWCRNQACYEACQKPKSSSDWREYTLADFVQALGLLFNEQDYYSFISLLNRLEQLSGHLSCRGCNKIMRPIGQSNFSLYRANQFRCTNQKCSKYGYQVYLSTCSNGKCTAVIDSRDSVRCNYGAQGYPHINGLYICQYCGSCCSKQQLNHRREALEKTHSEAELNNMTAYIRNKWHLEKELYHREKNEILCYKCAKPVKPRYGGWGNYICSPCGIEYKYDLVANFHKSE